MHFCYLYLFFGWSRVLFVMSIHVSDGDFLRVLCMSTFVFICMCTYECLCISECQDG